MISQLANYEGGLEPQVQKPLYVSTAPAADGEVKAAPVKHPKVSV